jgi:hypothetical protein
MDKANVSFIAIDVNDATNGRVVFNKGSRTVENFLQEVRLARIAGASN